MPLAEQKPSGQMPVARTFARQKFLTKILLASFMLLPVLISYFFLSQQSLRLDEAQSLWQSSHSPIRIFYVVAQDVHVPLYNLLLHFWQFLFGNSVPQTRFFSLALLLAAIPMVYLLGKTALNRNIGLFAALLVAVSPFLNWYGNEIRMYSLMTFITVLNQYFYIKIFKFRKTRGFDDQYRLQKLWWGYGLSALAGIYSHYFFAFVLLSEAIFYFFYRQQFPDKSLKKFAAVALILLAAIAPWIYYVYRLGMIGDSTPLLYRPTTINLFNTLTQFLFGFQDDHLNTIIVSLWPVSILFLFLALRKNSKITPETTFFFLSAIFPVITAFIISIAIRPLFLTRYLILAAPSLFIFLGWFLDIYPKKISLSFKALLVAAMLTTLAAQIANADTPVKEDYKSVAQYLDAQAAPQDAIAISAPFTIYPIEYYYKGPAIMSTLPFWDRYRTGPIPAFAESQLPQQVDQLKNGHQKIFLVLSYDQGYESKIKNYFDIHFEKLSEKKFSPDLNIYVYRVGYNNISLDNSKAVQNFGIMARN